MDGWIYTLLIPKGKFVVIVAAPINQTHKNKKQNTKYKKQG